MTEYTVDKLSNPAFANTNCVYVKRKNSNYLKIWFASKYAVFKVEEDPYIQHTNIVCMNTYQRMYMKCELGTKLVIEFVADLYEIWQSKNIRISK